MVACGPDANNVFTASTTAAYTADDACPVPSGGGGMYLGASGSSTQGQGAIWQASAPAGLEIVGVYVPPGDLLTSGINEGSTGQFGGDFYWAGGSSTITPGEDGADVAPIYSNYFGFLIVCGRPTCSVAGNGNLAVAEANLTVRETTPPSLSSPTGLWASKGWVRGNWNLFFTGDSPTGLCGLSASFDEIPFPGTASGRDPSVWHQCAAPPVSDWITTAAFQQGANTLKISAWDAAGEITGATRTVNVDNRRPRSRCPGRRAPLRPPAPST